MKNYLEEFSHRLQHLRMKAELQLKRAETEVPPELITVSSEILHELSVHEIELEMQNEELQRTQHELAASHAHYLELYDFAPVGYLSINAEGIITELNLTAAKMLGKDRKQIANRRFAGFIANEFKDRWYRHFVYAKQTPGNHGCELPISRDEVTTHYFHLDCIHLEKENAPPLLRITMTDITKRKQIEEDLRVAAAAFETQDGIVVTDDKKHILRVNQAFSQITGYSNEEVIGKMPDLLRSSLHDDAFYDAIWEAMKQDGFWRGEVWEKRKNGEIFPVLLAITAVTDPDRHITHYVGSFKDITERKKLEQAQQDADRRKDEYLAMLGHELRNPLTPISNVAQILSVQALEDPKLDWVSDVLSRNVTHIAQLIDDLLDASRITFGLVKINRERIEITQLLKNSADSVQSLLQAKAQSLHFDLPEQPVYVEGDPVRLTQVFSNILDNAAKYTDEGGRIDLIARAEDKSVSVRVQDNGVGIEADLLPHIFDLFTQGARKLDRPQGGLGLGLTLVKKLVELHGGHISAYSQGRNKGSEFVVKLPGLLEKMRLDEGDSDCMDQPNAKNLKVLLIDDNQDILESVSLWLKMGKHEVETAHTGAQGVAVAQTFKPDVILLDIGLPDMDGYQVADLLRQQPMLKSTQIIALSGYEPKIDPLTINPGFNHYLIKPLNFKELNNLICAYQHTQTEE